ncbi:hypothetical protein R69746_06944 [Paraburkholderia aspalathi]|uniref:GPO family capsid scaffolding protein n=1 Tax=Paraburkholderia aspalathi TaxID=1324617 RepID=UPI00190A4618|nr:GPO family capsid scaffolding protein [Paraburkholderia aspalathi]MBK3842970.1 GPO family capsid scaffolding protein [Paraburkholderia aspalathi]CAE6841499.1 hypothetical protein R69746_06944 [Paraburkholderia aspalathi]
MFKRKLLLLSVAVAALTFAFALDAHAAALSVGSILNQGDIAGALGGHGLTAIGAGLGIGIGSIASTGGNGNHAAKSKWFRVAVEGATTDGRSIERDWIQQMASSYNPTVYGARINCEHIRGYAPMSPNNPFGAYGDVSALKAEAIADGPLKGKLALYAQITPTQALIDLMKASQKIYTSIEISYSFADTKQAYLMGLAVTDSPASLGTEMLSFAASQGDKNPLASRKQVPDNLFSAAEETMIEFDAAQPPEPAGGGVSVFARVAEILSLVKNKGATDDKRFADTTQAIEALATHGQEQAGRVDGFATQLARLTVSLESEKKAREATDTALADLTAKLSQQSGGQSRPLSTGSDGVIKTDC